MKGVRRACWPLALALAMVGCGSLGQATVAAPLTASGVVAVEEVRVASELQGDVRAVHVGEGDEVTAGQVLVVLGSAALDGQLKQAEAALARAKADLAQASAPPTPQTLALACAQVTLAEAAVEPARAALEAAQARVADPQELRGRLVAAETQAALAAQGVDAAKADYQRALYERDKASYNSDQQRALGFVASANQATVEAAQADEHTAQVVLTGLHGLLAHPLELEAALRAMQRQVTVTLAARDVAQASLRDLEALPQTEEVASAQARVEVAQAQLALARAQVERLTVRAPRDGRVLVQGVKVGETAMPAATLLVIGELAQVKVSVFVPEARVGEVKLGQAVQVRVDAFRQRTFAGTVIRIADRAEYTPRNVATAEGRRNTFYAVEITLANSDRALKPGMPADVEFRG